MRRIAVFMFAFVMYSVIFGANSQAEIALEPFTYSQDFESRELNAWASYPPWQDTAYDPNMRVNTMVPGDPNISIEQKVTPYTNANMKTAIRLIMLHPPFLRI